MEFLSNGKFHLLRFLFFKPCIWFTLKKFQHKVHLFLSLHQLYNILETSSPLENHIFRATFNKKIVVLFSVSP